MRIYDFCKQTVDNHIDRMHYLCDIGDTDAASALHEEIREWIIEKNNIEVISLEYLRNCT